MPILTTLGSNIRCYELCLDGVFNTIYVTKDVSVNRGQISPLFCTKNAPFSSLFCQKGTPLFRPFCQKMDIIMDWKVSFSAKVIWILYFFSWKSPQISTLSTCVDLAGISKYHYFRSYCSSTYFHNVRSSRYLINVRVSQRSYFFMIQEEVGIQAS